MGAKWTKEQQRVIDLRGENLLVSAAAGSGKTAVLVERIVSRITDRKSPADVDSLLVVTFTEAAAAEMKERIGAAIEKKLEENPQDENLIRQAALVYTAPITTIHSFCLSVIREHFHVIGLDPAFRVGEEGELTLLKQDVMDALLEEQYALGDAAFLSFAEKYGTGRTDQKIEELILKLYEYSRSYPWPEDWLNSCLSLYRADMAHPDRLEEMTLAEEAVSLAKNQLKDIRKLSERALAICHRAAGPAGYEAAIQADLELIDGALQAKGYRELQPILGNISWKRLGRCTKDTDPYLCETVKELRERVKKAAKALADTYFYAPIEVWAADLAACLPDMETLIGLVRTFAESYAGEKRRRNLIDFDDMEHMALQILTESEMSDGAADAGVLAASADNAAEAAGNPTAGASVNAANAAAGNVSGSSANADGTAGAYGSSARAVRPSAVAREYRERFTEVMVDEYQDSSLVQEMILQMVSGVSDGRNNRFMVGDVKQSIYRFRLSRPELFMEKYNTYRADAAGEPPAVSSAEQNAAERDASGQQTADLLIGHDAKTEDSVAAPAGQNLAGKESPAAAARASGQNLAEEGVRIDLHKNFRSRPEVLDSVNHVFGRIMRRELGGIAYDDRAALYPGAVFPPLLQEDSAQAAANPAAGAGKTGSPYRTEFLLYDKSPQDSLDAKEAEARVIAQRMKELRQSALVTDRQTGGYRRVQYRDMVVLFRSAKGWTDVFQEVFEEEGIPAYSVSREGYFSAYEVSLLLDYLKLLDNARQDHPLAAVLASPLVGLTDREMAEIRAACPEGPFYEAVRKYAGTGETTGKPGAMHVQSSETQTGCKAAAVLADFFAQLADFRMRSHYTAIHELLQQIITETGYDLIISAMPGGAQRLANVEMLMQKAAAFEETSYKGLFNFVRYIEQLKKYDVDYGEAGMLDEQADAVRLMTIHKSKGLEFPIVFAAGMGKNFNMTDSRSSAALDADLGAGIDFIDLDSRTKTPTFLKRVIQQKIKRENLAEEMRVLYVAMTRAKEKLILSGSAKLEDAGPEKYSRPMDENGMLDLLSLESASGFLDWVLPAVLDSPRPNAASVGIIAPAADRTAAPVDIRLFTETDLAAQAAVDARAEAISQQELENWNPDATYIPGAAARLDAQMNFVYPYVAEKAMKLKFTVSELKKRAGAAADDENGAELYEEPAVIPLIPRFQMEEEQAEGGLTGAGRGTAYHAFMEMLDLQASYDAQSLQEALRQFEKEGRLSAEMAACIRVKDILRFLQSKVARRMAEAQKRGRLYREQPFVLGVDAAQIYPEIYAAGTAGEAGKAAGAADQHGMRQESAAAAGTADEPGARQEEDAAAVTAEECSARQKSAAAAGTAEEHGMRQEESQAAGTRRKAAAAEASSGRETILVQGIIDVWFEEDDGLVVLDYKTDHVSRPQELIDRYRAQLDYYAQALEQLLEKPVKEKIIYSFCLGKEILL